MLIDIIATERTFAEDQRWLTVTTFTPLHLSVTALTATILTATLKKYLASNSLNF